MRRLDLGVLTAAVLFSAATSARSADPPCFDNANRYVNCGNGTVTDTATGLVWLQKADCFTPRSYASANRAATTLKNGRCGLTDGSVEGDWRLPTKDEWTATIGRAVVLGCFGGSAPSLTNDPGTGCLESGPSSFTGVQLSIYWSSSAVETSPNQAWGADLINGNVGSTQLAKTSGRLVWAVRSAP
jgi:hypothetical protein